MKIGWGERLNLVKTILRGNTTSVTQSLSRFIPLYGEPPKNSTLAWMNMYNLSPRMNPVHQIASDVASSEFSIMLKDNKLENHPLELLLNNVSSDNAITKYGLFYITQVYLLLPAGEAFWLKERNGVGAPTELWPIPPNWVVRIPSKTQNFFWVQPMGNMDASPIPVFPEDMVYFKKLDITNPYLRGVGRLNAIGDEIETDEYMAKYSKKFFYNGAIPEGVGMAPGADENTLDRIREEWQQKYGGYNNNGKMAWLGWDAKIQVLKETTKEMDFVESRKYLRDTTNQHFSIPPEIFGILENSNRATIDAAYYLYTKNVLRKELCFIADTINRQLLPDFGKNETFLYENIVPEDEEFDLKKANEGIARGVLTIDEWRLANGYDELPNNKGKVLYVPSTCIAISLDGLSIPEEVTANKPKAPEIKNQKALSKRDSLWEVLDKAALSGEPKFITSLQKFFLGQEQRMLAQVKESKAYEEDINWDEEDKKLLDVMTPLWLDSFKKGYNTVNEAYQFGVNFDLINPKFLDWVDKQGADEVKGINETTKEQLRKTIAEGISATEGVAQIRKRIREVFDTASKSRANMIARTETHNTVSAGTFETYKGAKVKKKEWLSTSDNRTRDSHGAINREIKEINKPFSNGLMYPGASGPASEVINCRCTLLPVIDEDRLNPIVEPIEAPKPPKPKPKPLPPMKTDLTKLKDLHPEVGPAIRKQIDKLYRNHPEAFNSSIKHISLEELSANRNASYVTWKRSKELSEYDPDNFQSSAIRLSNNFKTNANIKKRSDNVKAGWNPKGTGNVAGTVVHEIGHAVDADLRRELYKKDMKLFNAYEAELKTLFKKVNKTSLSEYSTRDMDEMVAEGFVEVYLSPTPRPTALKIKEIMDRHLKMIGRGSLNES